MRGPMSLLCVLALTACGGAGAVRTSLPLAGQVTEPGGAAEVDAFPAAANGSTVPARRIVGFYHASTTPVRNGAAAGAVGTAADSTLYVLGRRRART